MENFALVTGASSGIGRALAEEAAKDGFNLILVSGDEGKLKEAENDLRQAYPHLKVLSYAKNLATENGPKNIFDEIKREGIKIHTLINDAGVGHNEPFRDYGIDIDLNMIRLNIEAVVSLCKLFLQETRSSNEGRILNVGSIAGFQPGPLLAVYHATKAFVNSFSEALGEELKDTKITVTCLCPGPTDTEFFDRAEMDDAKIVQKGPIMDPKKVAEAGYQAMKDGERTYIPGFTNKALTFMRRVMPKSMQAKMNKKMYESVEETYQ
jgi:short-subunit dehydrogenase